MKLSIITVNLNNREGLRKTAESVVSQTYKDYEWIVIDGGSTDGSRELIEQYAEHISYWVSEPDKGIYNAMNKGIKVAKGEYLQFLNSGDWLFEESTLGKCFCKQHYGDVIYGNVMHIIDNRFYLATLPNQISLYYFMDHFINHQASFIKRNIFLEHMYDESLKIYADWAMCIRLVFENKCFEYVNQCIAYYNFEGISSHITQEHIKEKESIWNTLVSKYIDIDLQVLKSQKQEIDRYKSIETLVHRSKLYMFLMKFTLKIIKILDKALPLSKNE